MHTRAASALLLAAVAACSAASPAQAEAPKKPPTPNGPRVTTYLAAGCFWGVEHWMASLDGIADIEVGYIGGTYPGVSYEQVTQGNTGHAEAVKIVFDPSVISYEKILERFYKIHDPTTKNRQGNDKGTQYRSAIFPTSDAAKKIAKAVSARANTAWNGKLSTTIEAPVNWVKAEAYHQDYLVKNPGGYDNHFMRDLKM